MMGKPMCESRKRLRAQDGDRRGTRRRTARGAALGLCAQLLLLHGLHAPATAQEVSATFEQQYSVLARVMTYDRNLRVRAGDTLVIGIIYQSWFGPSLDARNQLGLAIDESPFKRIRGLPVRYVSIDIGDVHPSARELVSYEVDVLYIAPVSGINIRTIAALCRENGVTSVTGVSEYLEQGVAVAIAADGLRPRIIVHLPAARAEGADFSSQLLKLAQVVR